MQRYVGLFLGSWFDWREFVQWRVRVRGRCWPGRGLPIQHGDTSRLSNANAISYANWHAHCNLHANTHGNAHPDANCDARANVPRQIAAGDEIGAPRDASGWGPWPMDL